MKKPMQQSAIVETTNNGFIVTMMPRPRHLSFQQGGTIESQLDQYVFETFDAMAEFLRGRFEKSEGFIVKDCVVRGAE